MTGKIELAEQKAELAIMTKANELTNHIAASARSVTNLAEEQARELARHIEEAERRANEAAQAEATRQVDDLLQRSKKTTAGLRDRIQALEAGTADLAKNVVDLAATRQAEDQKLTEALTNAMRTMIDRVEKEERARLAADERAEALTRRVAELEKPARFAEALAMVDWAIKGANVKPPPRRLFENRGRSRHTSCCMRWMPIPERQRPRKKRGAVDAIFARNAKSW